MDLFKPIATRAYALLMPSLLLFKTVTEWLSIKFLFGHSLPYWFALAPYAAFREVDVNMRRDFIMNIYLAWTFAFVLVGLWLTIRRLRTLNRSLWSSLWFFVPYLNVIQYYVLVFVAKPHPNSEVKVSDQAWFARTTEMCKSLAITLTFMIAYVTLSVYIYHSYGAVLFFASPFVFGVLNGYLLNRKSPIGRKTTQLTSAGGLAMIAGALLLLAMEGVMCIAMAAPLALATSAIGALVGEFIALRVRANTARIQVFALLGLLPMSGLIEANLDYVPPLREVVSSIEIAAPPEVVWKYIVEVPTLPPPEELSFRIGIAYPVRAYVSDWKLGATRVCTFNTGDAMETITAFEPARLLRFRIDSQPAQMEELSPYEHVHAPHLHGFVVSEHGEFRLTKLPNGHTLLEGTSWYRNHIAPGKYWAVFTDQFVHQIHHRVFKQVKKLSEDVST